MTAILKEFYDNILKKKSFWIPMLFFTWAAYGFSMMNRTISMDDLATPFYVDGTVWLSEYRWGAVLWKKLFSFGDCTPYIDKFLSVHQLMAGAVVAVCIMYLLNGRQKKVWLYTIPACIMVTFPLLNEIWEYTCGATIVTAGDFLLVGTAILWQLVQKKPSPKSLALSSLILTFVVCSAESQACVYITSVLLILFYRHCVWKGAEEKKTAWLTEGISFALPLAISVVLRFISGKIIMTAMSLERTYRGATAIKWPLSRKELVSMLRDTFEKYVVRGLVYFPIGTFVVCCLIFAVIVLVLAISRKKVLPLILGLFTGLSLFALMLLQGMTMYYRTAVNFVPFVGFVIYLLLEWILNMKRQTLARIAVIFLVWFCWRQSACMHKILALNNQRSENEADLLQQIGYRLVTEYPGRKVLIFGDSWVGNQIRDQITADPGGWNGKLYYKLRAKVLHSNETSDVKFLETNVCDTIDWYHTQFEAQLMDEYFSYFGYDVDYWSDIDEDHKHQIWLQAKERTMHAYELWDQGECVVVSTADLE